MSLRSVAHMLMDAPVDGGLYARQSGSWIVVPSSTGGLPEAPTGGQVYGRQGSTTTWLPVLPTTGGTVTGATTFSGTGSALTVTNDTQLGTLTINGTGTALHVTNGASVTGTLGVGSTISIGNTVGAAPASTTISTPNGSHINLLPQGAGRVRIGSGIAGLDFGGGGTQSVTIAAASLGPGAGTGFYQTAGVSGSAAMASILGFNQWNVNSDNAALTGQPMFHTAINYNYGGAAFTGNRGGLIIGMNQTGVVAGSSGAGGVVAAQFSATTNNTFGGTNIGPGAAGAVFGANIYNIMKSGSTNMLGQCGLEIDVEADTGSSYQTATGLALVTTTGHQQPAVQQTYALTIGGQVNSIGFDTGISVSSWGFTSGGVIFNSSFSSSRPTFNVAKGFDLRTVTCSGDIFGTANFAVGPTGRVRVGTGYLDYNASGVILDAAGAVCTAGTLTAAVTTTYPGDGNSYWCDDPYGGMWSVNFPSGATSIAAITMVVAPVVQGTPPANPVTLTPRDRLKIFGAAPITANLTWDTSRTALSLNPSGGPTTFGGTVTLPAGTTGPWLLLTGGTVTGATTFSGGTYNVTCNNRIAIGNGTGTASEVINGAVTAFRGLSFQSNGSNRWQFLMSANSESGNNVGSDLSVLCFADDGATQVFTPITLSRSNKTVQLASFTSADITGRTTGYGGLSISQSYTSTGPVGGFLNGGFGYNAITINSDTVQMGNHTGNALLMNQNFGGSTMTGGRQGLAIFMGQTAATGNKAAGIVPFYNVLQANLQVNSSDGGTNLTNAGAFGNYYAFNPQVILTSGAINIAATQIAEFNTSWRTGSSGRAKVGVQFVKTSDDAVKGYVNHDTCIGIYDQAGTAVGWDYAIRIGGTGNAEWPMDQTSGTLLGVTTGSNYSTTGLMQTGYGVDLVESSFNNYAFRSRGFAVNNTGQAQIGTGLISQTGAGMSIDASGAVGTGTPTISAGGSGFAASTTVILKNRAYGAVYIGQTNASGAVASITSVVCQPVANTNTSLPATLAVVPWAISDGSGCVLNVTWNTTATTLALNPSGGPTTFGGPVTLPPGTVPTPSTTTPNMDGTAAIGSLTPSYALADHVHPSDTSRLALTGGTLTGPLNETATVANGAGSGAMLQMGDTVAANNLPLCYSYAVGASGGASMIGSNIYFNASATAVRVNSAKNGFYWLHDDRATTDGTYTLHVINSSGGGATVATFDQSGSVTMGGGVTATTNVVGTQSFRVGGGSGPTWTTGTTAPSSTQPVGSIYSNTSGAAGARLYVSAGGGTWTAVAGV